jgi:predicted nucleic acid-binding protein
MATVYIETTIPSYCTARLSDSITELNRQQKTREWWDAGHSGLDPVSSLETVLEAGGGDPVAAEKRLAFMTSIPPLTISDSVITLAEELVSAGIIPQKAASDAIHIAVCAFHGVDYLATWNFKHIANPFLRDKIRRKVTEAGFSMPIMTSPEELLQNDEDS